MTRKFEKTCIICGTDYLASRKTSKYCSRTCCYKGQKGEPRPHSQQWENNRLKSIRENSWKNKGKKNPKSKETIKIALEAFKKKKLENPEKYNEIFKKNLPKDVKGEKNGNWKGGKTKEYKNFRIQNYSVYYKWRKNCLHRDGYKCRLCDSTTRLQVHHIIPISLNRYIAWEVWNGVTLCRQCHYENDECWSKGVKFKNPTLGRPENRAMYVYTIRPEFQEYPTAGNYKEVGDNVVVFLISKQVEEDYEYLIFIHEFVEYVLTKRRGIKEPDIDKYDKDWEKRKRKGEAKADEPGNEPDCPYRIEHRFSENMERIVAQELGINWFEYESKLKI